MSLQHAGEQQQDEEVVVAKAGIRVEHRIDFCPVCDRPLAKHSAVQLMRCSSLVDDDEDDEAVTPEPQVHAPQPAPKRVLTRSAAVEPAPIAAPVELLPAPTKIVLPDGEIDYEQLAGALKLVIEKERDEIVRRGGPLEKQNIELKEKLFDALEQAGMWRSRFQRKCEEYNLLKEQNEELIRTNRKQRNELAGRKASNDSVRILELPGLIRVAEKHAKDGWEVRRQGNGHFGFYLHNQFITDAASSGQGNKVNMATRNKLKKAGLPV